MRKIKNNRKIIYLFILINLINCGKKNEKTINYKMIDEEINNYISVVSILSFKNNITYNDSLEHEEYETIRDNISFIQTNIYKVLYEKDKNILNWINKYNSKKCPDIFKELGVFDINKFKDSNYLYQMKNIYIKKIIENSDYADSIYYEVSMGTSGNVVN